MLHSTEGTFDLLEDEEEEELITYNYFGAHHGKGPADGAIAVVKNCVSRAVKSRNAKVTNSEDFFDFCNPNLSICSDTKRYARSFQYVTVSEINDKKSNRKTVSGTRSVQSVN